MERRHFCFSYFFDNSRCLVPGQEQQEGLCLAPNSEQKENCFSARESHIAQATKPNCRHLAKSGESILINQYFGKCLKGNVPFPKGNQLWTSKGNQSELWLRGRVVWPDKGALSAAEGLSSSSCGWHFLNSVWRSGM